jgi:SAM-dependent methyltransferase
MINDESAPPGSPSKKMSSGIANDLPEDRGYEKVAHLYDLFDQKPNIEFFYHYASQAKETLDIGAGTGRIAIALAERGVRVCCIEPSPAMRREFEDKLAQKPHLAGNIQIIAADARSFDVDATFPMVYLSGTFDHFLDCEERLSSLINIGRHLAPGGTLVFDVFLGLMKDAPLSPAGRAWVGEREVRRFVGGKILPGARKEVVLAFEVYQDGEMIERIEERGLVGVTGREDVHRVLEAAGFEVQREWGDYDFRPYQEGDALLVVEAVKR